MDRWSSMDLSNPPRASKLVAILIYTLHSMCGSHRLILSFCKEIFPFCRPESPTWQFHWTTAICCERGWRKAPLSKQRLTSYSHQVWLEQVLGPSKEALSRKGLCRPMPQLWDKLPAPVHSCLFLWPRWDLEKSYLQKKGNLIRILVWRFGIFENQARITVLANFLFANLANLLDSFLIFCLQSPFFPMHSSITWGGGKH